MRHRAAQCLLGVAAVALLFVGGLPVSWSQPTPQVATVRILPRVVGMSHLEIGVTHTQYTPELTSQSASQRRGVVLLRTLGGYQNQYLYGWGVGNPEPSPGVYNWSDLDRRMALIRATHGIPVLTLCCAPDWMTALGTNSSRYPNLPPTPAHVADFAALARAAVQRYPEVRYVQVWSELRGYRGENGKPWATAQYVQLYNAVYDAVKAVAPDVQVGGPYLTVDYSPDGGFTRRTYNALLSWCLHAHGFDFVSIDGAGSFAGRTNVHATLASMMAETAHFETVSAHVLRLIQRTSGRVVPLWWAESYFSADLSSVANIGDGYQAAALTSILLHQLKGGASVSLRWQPQGVGAPPHGNEESLFSDTRLPDGGRPFSFYYDLLAVRAAFGPGTPLRAVETSTPDIEALASAQDLLLVNKAGAPVRVQVLGAAGSPSVSLDAYEVRRIPLALALSQPKAPGSRSEGVAEAERSLAKPS